MRSPEDPLDHARTTRPHAGEAMKDTKNFPALVLLGVALAAFVCALFAFGTAHASTGTVLAVIAAIVFAISMSWFLIEHRRVRRFEDADRPDSSS